MYLKNIIPGQQVFIRKIYSSTFSSTFNNFQFCAAFNILPTDPLLGIYYVNDSESYKLDEDQSPPTTIT